MASTRKSRMVNKRFSKVNEESPDKDGGNSNKSRPRKRKLSVMLGSQWSKEELERFYDAYRKYGKDWKKVASVIRNRSADMVEALYNMNRAYLSLPEGTASVAGLIAMMTDHYNLLEGSDSERESNDGVGASRKPQKRGRGKFKANSSKGSDGPFPDLLQHQSIASSYGCLSLLKKKRSGGTRPHAVGKRTPRVPVSYLHDKDGRGNIVSPNKQGLESAVDADDDEVACVAAAALALAGASQRGGSPQVSHTPSRRTEHMRASPIRSGERKQAESEIASTKATDEDCLEGSLGSREAENGDFAKDTESAGAVGNKRKGKKFQGKKRKAQGIENNHFDDVREACSGTEEGLALKAVKDEVDVEVTDGKAEGPRKRSRQLYFEDESFDLYALQTLADLSLNIDAESSVRVKEEKRNVDTVEKPNVPEATSANHQRDRPMIGPKLKGKPSVVGDDINTTKNAKIGKDLSVDVSANSEGKQQSFQPTGVIRKRKRKSAEKVSTTKAEVRGDSLPSESQKAETIAEEGKKSVSKGKRAGQIFPSPKQGKSARPPERSSSTTDLGRTGTDLPESTVQVSSVHQVNLPTKARSRRKMDIQKVLARKEPKSAESVGNDRPDKYSHLIHDKAADLKTKLSHCLSSQMLRRWCAFEWFYSAIDYPWFARSEFVEYLNHVGLGHVPRLTRVEWGVIRSSLGKPRRLSKQFLREEREKLEEYREKVRTHYAELRAGIRDGLPTDLARPLSVGQRVIACHPKTREIHDGNVLTVDRNRCRVQFDRPELGVEFVMDIDCMPLNPLENLSEALRRQSSIVDKFRENNDLKLDSLHKDIIKFPPSENLENADGFSHVASPNYPMNTLMKQAKGDTLDDIVQAKATANEVAAAQAMYGQPSTLEQIQAREADVQALSELSRALDKKEALLLELKHMNEEVMEILKEGDTIKDEHFRKQYAMVLVQLSDASNQVTSALYSLRQRNTFHGNSPPPWFSRPMVNSGGPAGPPSSFDHSAFPTQDSGSQVAEILESSRRKARVMVDAAMQAMSALKEGEDAFARIGEAIDLASNRFLGTDFGVSVVRSFTPSDQGHRSSAYHDQATSCTSEPVAVHSSGLMRNGSSNWNEAQLPLELMSSCVATLLMIQTCTERQYPPAEVAQILDSAVKYLQPCCNQNSQIYRDIQQCIGMVKNQVLALIPTQTAVLPTELSTM
ncbi:protein ALWAYS EARLY 2-like [Magnolia sinica]|uniref:protein ALWAYS EARLY 2-like n=1 Tax=Magnolia sinica TaxID=86752 RepID=UPI002659D69A|nr:protein ALWAYS EARLY 2-like [Magnolia sinica]